MSDCNDNILCTSGSGKCPDDAVVCLTTDSGVTCTGDGGAPIFAAHSPSSLSVPSASSGGMPGASARARPPPVQVAVLGGGYVDSNGGSIAQGNLSFRDNAIATRVAKYEGWLRTHLAEDACMDAAGTSVDDVFVADAFY